MFELVGFLHKILIPKRTKNDYYVLPIVISYKYKDADQLRYMQCVTQFSQQQVLEIPEGERVVVKLVLKGQHNKDQDKFYNLDEVESIIPILKK